jgi:hypothetical protein
VRARASGPAKLLAPNTFESCSAASWARQTRWPRSADSWTSTRGGPDRHRRCRKDAHRRCRSPPPSSTSTAAGFGMQTGRPSPIPTPFRGGKQRRRCGALAHAQDRFVSTTPRATHLRVLTDDLVPPRPHSRLVASDPAKKVVFDSSQALNHTATIHLTAPMKWRPP